MATSIFILSASALPLAQVIKSSVGGQIIGPDGLADCDANYHKAVSAIGQAFADGTNVIGICASGILIRSVASHLRDKHREPAVVAVAEDGSCTVPLLGGHHGANQLARDIAKALGGQAAITTASDVVFGKSFDEPGDGYVLGNPEHMKSATAAKLRGEAVEIVETVHLQPGHDLTLVLHPKVLCVGLGCERGTTPEEIRELISSTFSAHHLSQKAVATYASIDLKEDEPAISSLRNVRYFTAAELQAFKTSVKNPSSYVEEAVGSASVAEAAALAAAGPGAELIVEKSKSKRATIAIAKAAKPVVHLPGRSRGSVFVVGIGPGGKATRSADATSRLALASDWVGYSLYLDLINDLHTEQTHHDFPLGDEEKRCRHAIDLARQGKQVALVCSGDAGIYAMAALVYELIDREPCRVAVEVHPGISAFQLASAKAGAMIGHDFCCISLSDLLTPWETIVQRVTAAAEGDFVISFYNPRSLKRTDQIVKAFDILRPRRNADTPVVLASNLGRPEENVRIIRFDEFKPEDVDMLTLVMVGSSQSKAFKRGDGKISAYTPRGYARKMEPL